MWLNLLSFPYLNDTGNHSHNLSSLPRPTPSATNIPGTVISPLVNSFSNTADAHPNWCHSSLNHFISGFTEAFFFTNSSEHLSSHSLHSWINWYLAKMGGALWSYTSNVMSCSSVLLANSPMLKSQLFSHSSKPVESPPATGKVTLHNSLSGLNSWRYNVQMNLISSAVTNSTGKSFDAWWHPAWPVESYVGEYDDSYSSQFVLAWVISQSSPSSLQLYIWPVICLHHFLWDAIEYYPHNSLLNVAEIATHPCHI